MADDNFVSPKFPKYEPDVKVGFDVENNSEFDCQLPIISIERTEVQVEKTAEVVMIPSQNQSIDINQLLRLKGVPIASIAVNNITTEPEVKFEGNETSQFNNNGETNQVEKTSEVVVIPTQNRVIDINQLVGLKAVPIASIIVNNVKTEPVVKSEENETPNGETNEVLPTEQSISHNKPLLRCLKCEKWLGNTTLLLHLECTDVVCPVCHRRFSDSKDYHEHALLHTNHKAFKCHLCLKCFKTDTSLRQHCLQSHSLNVIPDFIVTCPACQKQFNSSVMFSVHYSTHSDLKPFQCPVCPVICCTRAALRSHVIQVHMKPKMTHSKTPRTFIPYKDYGIGEERFRCCTCSKVFDNKTQAKSHAKYHYRHDNVRKCKRCQQQFSNTAMLLKHNDMVHRTLAEKALICDDCDEIFYFKVSICKHVMRHVQPKDTKHLFVPYKTTTGMACYRCSTCYKLFETIEQARSHRNDNRIFRCLKCNLEFSKRVQYVQHHYLAHRTVAQIQRRLICDQCGRIFVNKCNFQMHVVRHMEPKKTTNISHMKHLSYLHKTSTGVEVYKCSTCYKEFETSKRAETHRLYYNRKIFGCRKCNLRFSNQVEIKRHYYVTHLLPRRTYICDDCGKSSFHKFLLSTHVSRSCQPKSCIYKHWRGLAPWALPATVSAKLETGPESA